MQKIISIVLVLVLFAGIGWLLTRENTPASSSSSSSQKYEPKTPAVSSTPNKPSTPESNVVVKDGVQYITITAKGGYSPRLSQGQSGIPTKLIVKTNGTYDCSASLVIRDINFQQILPQTGDTTIDLGTPKPNQILQGVCGMGMYNFQISFK